MEVNRQSADQEEAAAAPASRRTRGIVLAGTYPKAHSPLDELSLRPLLPVAHQPLITYALRWMRAGGLNQATICTNRAARALPETFDGSAIGMSLRYIEDWTPRGTAGCLRDAALRSDAQTFVVADATTVPVVDLWGLLDAHHASRAAVTVVASHDRRADGDETARMRPSGVYVVDRRTLAHIAEEGYVDIKEQLLPSLYRATERVTTYSARDVSPRVFDTQSYLALNQWAVERSTRYDEPPPGYHVAGDAVVHESAVVAPEARLLGPVLLGPGVSVAPGATVVGPASIDKDSTIGRNAVVSRSALWSGCQVGDEAFVDRCMLTDGASVGAGQVLYASLRGPQRGGGTAQVETGGSLRSPWAPLAHLWRKPTPHHL